MCGRAYSTYTDAEIAIRYLNRKRVEIPKFSPNYNLSPTQQTLVITALGSKPALELMRWQFVAPWEPEFKTKLSTINAKSESVFESRMYRGAIVKRRCLVPLSGFIEWKAEVGAPKRPFAIHLKDSPIMSMAGIWSTWREGEKDEAHSFAILTTEANSFMKKIHLRMPVILSPEKEQEWLDPELQDPKAIAKLMKPCPASRLTAHEVSTAINSPRNNRPEVLEPLAR